MNPLNHDLTSTNIQVWQVFSFEMIQIPSKAKSASQTILVDKAMIIMTDATEM